MLHVHKDSRTAAKASLRWLLDIRFADSRLGG
jgi:hypothetical protein